MRRRPRFSGSVGLRHVLELSGQRGGGSRTPSAREVPQYRWQSPASQRRAASGTRQELNPLPCTALSQETMSLVNVPLAVCFFDMQPHDRPTVLAHVGEKRLRSNDNRNHSPKGKPNALALVIQTQVNVANVLRTSAVRAVRLGLLDRQVVLLLSRCCVSILAVGNVHSHRRAG